jgi:tripartite-type tricarboxylate transporter receptor subunit TctC
MIFGSGQGGMEGASERGWIPTKSIEYIVPFSPGGSSDAMARIFETVGKQYFARPIVILNKPGGSMAIGLTELINSKPDGYTIATAVNGVAELPVVGDVPYQYHEVLTPIAQLGVVPYVCLVNANSPYQNLKDLADAIKTKPNGLVSGPSGAKGGATHWEMEKLAFMAGSDIKSILITDGGAAAVAQLLGNNIDVTVQAPTEAIQHIQAGTLRCIAVFGETRMKNPVFIDIPTAKEQGFDIVSELWSGIAGPPKMDSAALKYFEDAFANALKDPEVTKAIERLGFEVSYLNSANYGKKWKKVYDTFGDVVKSLGDRLEI